MLVVEFGDIDNGADIQAPSNFQAITRAMYNLTSVPQRNLGNRVEAVRAAADVGGGSAVNGMLFDRAPAEDYDAWAALGNPGWDWAGLLPYFRKVLCHFYDAPLLLHVDESLGNYIDAANGEPTN